MADKQRLDAALVMRGLAPSRERAKEYVAAGRVTVNGAPATKPSQPVAETDELLCVASEKYVGRGGYKLEKALEEGAFDLSGRVAMDVGASTGGFTQCLLEAGAARVFSVDVGRIDRRARSRPDERTHRGRQRGLLRSGRVLYLAAAGAAGGASLPEARCRRGVPCQTAV